MKLRQYQVDAFTDRLFGGNPAAVCILPHWLAADVLQAIAGENNLSETAFIVRSDNGFQLRWFTPVTEVDLCGHATLAAAHVLFEHLEHPRGMPIAFTSRSGVLTVSRRDDLLTMDFPSVPLTPCTPPAALIKALGCEPINVLAADDYVAVFESEEIVRSLTPDFSRLSQLDLRGVCVTAPGEQLDFVSRFFAPNVGIPEDPVTGSAHCKLAPYWSARLGKKLLAARQVSQRGGDIRCEIRGDRVLLSGNAVTFLEGTLFLDEARAQPATVGFD